MLPSTYMLSSLILKIPRHASNVLVMDRLRNETTICGRIGLKILIKDGGRSEASTWANLNPSTQCSSRHKRKLYRGWARGEPVDVDQCGLTIHVTSR